MREIKINIGGKDRFLKPTFENICRLETETGKSAMLYGQKIQSVNVSVKEVSDIIYHGLHGDADFMELSDIGKCVVEDGVMQYYLPITHFIQTALGGLQSVTEEQGASAKKN